jgi:hypothetical protein
MPQQVPESGKEKDEKMSQEDIDELCKEIAEAYKGVDWSAIKVPKELLDRLFPVKNT